MLTTMLLLTMPAADPQFTVENKVSSVPAFTVVVSGPRPVPTFRQPDGHTHTCPNGHTWDHKMDGGTHICPECGLFQNEVDPPGRLVPVTTTTATATYTLTPFGSAGGCGPAGCSPAPASRPALGWRLRRR